MKISLLATCIAFYLTLPCQAHDAKRPELNGWYKSLKNPAIHSEVVNDLGCCSYRDCHETEAEIRDNQWWARVGRVHIDCDSNHALDTAYCEATWDLTEWRPVPDYAVLKVANPTGSPVICHSEMLEIWCFVPDNQY